MDHDNSANRSIAEAAVAAFAAGWRAPHPHAWDDLLAEEAELVQPLLRHRVGRHALAEEYGRLLELIPDLRGEVLRWAAEGRTVRIELRLTGTLGRLPLRLAVTDQLTLDEDGRILRRQARLDPLPAVALLARQPAAWRRWWNSGVGPLLVRRKFLPHDLEHVPTPPLVRALAFGRLLLAVSAWVAPQRSARLVGLAADGPRENYLMRVFAGRAAALGLGTLTSRRRRQRQWQRLGLLVDLSDTAAAFSRGMSTRARVLGLLVTGGYAAAGISALRSEPEDASVQETAPGPDEVR